VSESTKKVLLVDASPDGVRLVREELALTRQQDYDLEVVGSLAAALKRVPEGGLDAILMDLMLPDTEGISAFLRLYPKAGSVPIIVLVSQADEDLGRMAEEKGALDYLIKQQLVSNLLEKALRYATDRTHTLIALKASELKYRELFQNVTAGVFQTSPDGKFLSANPAMVRLLGYDSEDELLGLDIARDVYMFPEARENWKAAMNEQGEIRNAELVLRRKDGRKIVVLENARTVRDQAGKVLYFQGALTDITEAHEQSKQLSYDASHDALTGLVNRRQFEIRLERTLESLQPGECQHALCYVDLDQFKHINDTCGHVAGDELLRQMGHMLHSMVRQGDTMARIGGDEFGVLLKHCTLENAMHVAKNLLRSIQDFQFVWAKRQFAVGASVGLVPIDDSFERVTDVMAAADAACYAAKDRGRNRLHVYQLDDSRKGKGGGDIQWASRVKKALSGDGFQLDVQPIISLGSLEGQRTYYEVLIRLQDDSGRQVPPGAFLPAVERYNMFPQLDYWVIENTISRLSDNHRILNNVGRIFINLSAETIVEPDFPAAITHWLRQGKLPPHRLCFEITEAAAQANLTKVNQAITKIRQLGCKFALDDFGAGVSSFAYLKALPVDYLKIDGVYVRDIADDTGDFEIVRAITDVGHAMDREVIAEAVESTRVLAKLREIGVDFVQGFAVAPPRSIDLLNTAEPEILGKLA